MPIRVYTLAAVQDECRLNASEALAGVIAFHLFNLAAAVTLQFEAKTKGAPDAAFTAIQATNLATGAQATSATAVGIYRIDASGELDIRARVSASTGSIDVYPGVSLG